jgi:hypothetical protein
VTGTASPFSAYTQIQHTVLHPVSAPPYTRKLVTDPARTAHTNSAYPNLVHTDRAHDDSAYPSPTRPYPYISIQCCIILSEFAIVLASLGVHCESLEGLKKLSTANRYRVRWVCPGILGRKLSERGVAGGRI